MAEAGMAGAFPILLRVSRGLVHWVAFCTSLIYRVIFNHRVNLYGRLKVIRRLRVIVSRFRVFSLKKFFTLLVLLYSNILVRAHARCSELPLLQIIFWRLYCYHSGGNIDVDKMTKGELEALLSNRLPQCEIICSIGSDGCLSVEVNGPNNHQFTIAKIDRSQYCGDAGASRLVREILEEMVLARQSSHMA